MDKSSIMNPNDKHLSSDLPKRLHSEFRSNADNSGRISPTKDNAGLSISYTLLDESHAPAGRTKSAFQCFKEPCNTKIFSPTRSQFNTCDTAGTVNVPHELKQVFEKNLSYKLYDLSYDLFNPKVQNEIRDCLNKDTEFRKFITKSRQHYAENGYIRFGRGLGIEHGESQDEFKRTVAYKMLMGLALSMDKDYVVPNYQVENKPITRVQAREGATDKHHAENDKGAFPHTAEFFGSTPPLANLFACVQRHAQRGAETAVVNVEKIVNNSRKEHPEYVNEWFKKNNYTLITRRRDGKRQHPFTLMEVNDGKISLRFRKEYIVGFNARPELIYLERLLEDPDNYHIAHLQAGEVLMCDNTLPHARFSQEGATPHNPEERRLLIRLRVTKKGADGKYSRPFSDSRPSDAFIIHDEKPNRSGAELWNILRSKLRELTGGTFGKNLILLDETYWIEHFHPKHLSKEHLANDFAAWKDADTNLNFNDWLHNYGGARSVHPSKNGITYIPPEALHKYEARFFSHGKDLFINLPESFSNTHPDWTRQVQNNDETDLICILDENDKIYAGIKENNIFQHNSFKGSTPVKAAFVLSIDKKGKVLSIRESSEHYKTPIMKLEYLKNNVLHLPPKKLEFVPYKVSV